MQALPYIQTQLQDLSLVETKWASILNPLLRIPLLNGVQLTDVQVISGITVINTTLGRKYQGYIITGMRDAGVTVHEILSTNPVLNLTLSSTGAATLDIWIY